MTMNWYDVDDILLDGTKKRIQDLRCPDCSGRIKFSYSKYGGGRLVVICTGCHILEVMHKVPEPNCVKLFGKSATI